MDDKAKCHVCDKQLDIIALKPYDVPHMACEEHCDDHDYYIEDANLAYCRYCGKDADQAFWEDLGYDDY